MKVPQECRVVLTGASAGIGRAAALRFAALGCTVFAVARSRERLDELAGRPDAAGRILPCPADVADREAMEILAREIVGKHGPPHVVVANAGIGLDALFLETRLEAMHQLFQINVYGAVHTLRPFLPAMLEAGRGRVILVSSIVGKRGVPHYSIYSATKFALHGMADALRVELLGTGVHVGVLCPGSTATEFDERKIRTGPSQRRLVRGKHSADSVARVLVKMAFNKKREKILTLEGKLLHWTNIVAPGLLDRALAKMLLRRKA